MWVDTFGAGSSDQSCALGVTDYLGDQLDARRVSEAMRSKQYAKVRYSAYIVDVDVFHKQERCDLSPAGI